MQVLVTMGKRVNVTLCAICLLLGFLSSCGHEHFVRADAQIGSIKRIAVLPLENFTSDEYAGEKIRRLIITELLSKRFDVTEPGDITQFLKELKIKSTGSMKLVEIQNAGRALNAEAVMLGSVEAFGLSKGISLTYPEVTINLRLVEVASGNVIWSMRHTSGGPDFWTRHFGSEGLSMSETAKKVVKEAVGTLL